MKMSKVTYLVRQAAIASVALNGCVVLAQSAPVSNVDLNGPWELRSACLNTHGKPTGCLPSAPGALRLVFSTVGTWRLAVPHPTAQLKSGLFEIRKDDLLPRNADGSLFQDWHLEYNPDGKHLVITNKKLIQTFERVTTTE